MWGHAVIFAWSDLIVDRSRKLVGWPAVTCRLRHVRVQVATPILTWRTDKNCSLFHAQSPDTGRGVHARSWRANRDVDVRR